MIAVRVALLTPSQADRLRTWMHELQSRPEEARATFADEGVRHERAMLVPTSDGPLAVYVMECEDYDKALDVFARSTHAVDLKHKQVLSEIGTKDAPVEVLFDLRA